MNSKIDDFNNKYSGIIFGISLFIIIIFLMYFSIINKEKKLNCVIPNQIVNNSNNYSYELTFTSDLEMIKLNVKRYNQKYLIETEKDGVRNSYYLNYLNVYEKASNGEYIKYRNDYIIENVDNNLLLLDYINALSLESTLSNNEEQTCYINRKKEITICINLDDSITLKAPNYNINYNIKEIGTVKDFNVKESGDNN